MEYYVTYRVPADADAPTRNSLGYLNHSDEPDTLDTICETCQQFTCEAELFDAAGFRRGWVHANGTYTLQ